MRLFVNFCWLESSIATWISSDDEGTAELRRLWEVAKVSLPYEVVTYSAANDLGAKLEKEGQYEEAKVIHLAALEGRRRVLGEEHTLASLNNRGGVFLHMEDYT